MHQSLIRSYIIGKIEKSGQGYEENGNSIFGL
nr:MAG TPA: hypothetical protein [Bacteriophage sp.]